MPSALRPLQLRSSSAHCVRELAEGLAKSWQGGSEHACVDAKVVVEEKLEEREEEEEKEVEDEEEEEPEEENNCDKI